MGRNGRTQGLSRDWWSFDTLESLPVWILSTGILDLTEPSGLDRSEAGECQRSVSGR